MSKLLDSIKEKLCKPEPKTERDTVLESVAKGNISLKDLEFDYKNDKEITLAAVSLNSDEFQYTTSALRADKDVFFAAVEAQLDGQDSPLKYASRDIKYDKECVLAAAEKDAHAIDYAYAQFVEDKDIMSAVVRNSPEYGLEKASSTLRADRDFVKEAISQSTNPSQYLANAPETILSDESIKEIAMQVHPDLGKFFHEAAFENVVDEFDEIYEEQMPNDEETLGKTEVLTDKEDPNKGSPNKGDDGDR